MELEDEADLAVAERGQLALAHRRQRLAVEPDLARGRPVERAEDVQQRALADPGLADDDHLLARRDVEVEVAQHLDPVPIAVAVRSSQTARRG